MNFTKQHLLLLLVFVFLFLGFKNFIPNKQKKFTEVNVYSINHKNDDLDISIHLNTETNSIDFNTINKVSMVIIYDFNGNKITKETPFNNRISLENLKENKYYFSFISDEKTAIKTLFLK
jgi:hypothetical protein